MQLGARCDTIMVGVIITPNQIKIGKGEQMFAKVETMKKECMEMFKGMEIKECALYTQHNDLIIKLNELPICSIIENIKIALDAIDSLIIETDKFVYIVKDFDKNALYELFVREHAENLMINTEFYNEIDSRTELYDEIYEPLQFMGENDFVTQVTITHQESFLTDMEIEITIHCYNEIEINGFFYKVPDTEKEWNEMWSEILRKEWVI